MLNDLQPVVAELVRNRVTTAQVPSSVYTVFTADGIAFSGCYGTATADGRPPTLDTAYRIASCTKSFTAAAVLQLRDTGALRLDDPITHFVDIGAFDLPRTATPPPAPTIGALLSMAGGLPTDNPWADRQESMSPARFQALCSAGFALSSAPGTRYEYSNLGYALLGAVVERVSGVSYHAFIRRRLLEPLGLHRAAFEAGRVKTPGGLADGFRRAGQQWRLAPVSGPGAFSAIGGLFMSANDLTAWCRWLAAGYALGTPGDQVLAPVSRREMQTLHQLDPPRMRGSVRTAGYGYGLEVELHNTDIIISHRGGYPGFSAQIAWNPDAQIGVVILENAPYAQSPAVTVLRRILAAVPTPPPAPWPATLRAREDVEHLLVRWDDTLADQTFADNLDLDQPRQLRQAEFADTAIRIGFTEESRRSPFDTCEPTSSSAAHLEWTLRGSRGAVRCAVTLTPLIPPRVQSIEFHDSSIRERRADVDPTTSDLRAVSTSPQVM